MTKFFASAAVSTRHATFSDFFAMLSFRRWRNWIDATQTNRNLELVGGEFRGF